jgi:small subunit ribosomal protein S19e
MVSIYDVEPRKLIEEMAKELEKMPEMAPPSWASFVKTGVNRERPPVEDNWWYVRSAAVVRSVYKLGPIGVSKLRTKYGGRKNRGYRPDATFKGSGNILRKILQKLELVGLMKQAQVGVHKGRELTPKGKSFVDKAAVKFLKGTTHKPTKVDKAEKPEAEEKKKPAKKKEVVQNEQV